jgi:hypothetical protein
MLTEYPYKYALDEIKGYDLLDITSFINCINASI